MTTDMTDSPESLQSTGGAATDDVIEKRPFIAKPEVVAQYLELKNEEVVALIQSVEGRQKIFEDLMKHEDVLRAEHTNFDPMVLQSQLEAAGETLVAKGKFLEEVKNPEKKSLFKRAWDAVRSYPKNHPWKTALIAAALVTGGVVAGFYFTGNWELLMTTLGLKKFISAAEAAKELAPVTPPTPPLPDGGIYDIPPPMPTPGSPEFIPH